MDSGFPSETLFVIKFAICVECTRDRPTLPGWIFQGCSSAIFGSHILRLDLKYQNKFLTQATAPLNQGAKPLHPVCARAASHLRVSISRPAGSQHTLLSCLGFHYQLKANHCK